MEKLLELLNESTNGRFKSEQDLRLCIEMRWYCRNFIRWLVYNDKIDLDIVREKLWIPCFAWYKKWEIITVKDVEDYEQVLMLLSISNSPIEDLILYLK